MSFFFDTKLKYLFPVINKAWEDESRNQIDKLSSKKLPISMVMADVTALAIVQNMAPTPSWMKTPEMLSLSKSFKYRK